MLISDRDPRRRSTNGAAAPDQEMPPLSQKSQWNYVSDINRKYCAMLETLRALPGNRLEALKGDRAGQFSIRINQQWRICFEWPDGQSGPGNVEIVDYH